MEIKTLYPAQCMLGESPYWHAGRGSYFWVDIIKGILHELNRETQLHYEWNVGNKVSLIVGNKDGRLVLAMQNGLQLFNPEDGSLELLVHAEATKPDNRYNDGACDSRGRLWVTTMHIDAKAGEGSLYCIDIDFKVTKAINSLSIPNGIVWSADNERMYFVDTMQREIRCYLFNKQNGEIYFENIAIHIPEEMGYPDGMAIDTDGMLWVALWGGGAVTQWDPSTGKLLQRIELPVPHVSNCTFSGENLDELIVTTARKDLDPQQLEQYPESGNVFIITNLDAKGISDYKTNY
ncbi:MAG: SMP-30/gluconolactonase/LRE family protein [Sphingobacteriaceae bacterium]|nr:MAG: SMP-30/gluconolactonase/LRE family protein [Sphingobacteriaceae bacterium]